MRLRLEAIASMLDQRGPVELDNLAVDLRAVERRLESGQYQESDFAARNIFDVARRTREYLTYLQGWQRQAVQWAELLRAADPEPTDVLDLCPGPAPKVELALCRLGFRGRMRVLDKDEPSLVALANFMTLFSPSFSIEGVRGDVFDDPPRAQSPLVVANHAIDDLVLDLWSTRSGASTLDLYEDETKLSEAWRALLSESRAVLRSMPETIAAALGRHVTPNGKLVLVQYPSHHEGLLGVEGVGALFLEVFDRVLESLREKEFIDYPVDPRSAMPNKSTAVLVAPPR